MRVMIKYKFSDWYFVWTNEWERAINFMKNNQFDLLIVDIGAVDLTNQLFVNSMHRYTLMA